MASWKKVVVSGSAITQLNNDANYISSDGQGILSSSAQIGAEISGSLSAAAIVDLGANLVSSSGQIDGANITNNTVGFGGVSVALNGSDDTPAFDLADATNYPGDSNLVTVGAVDAGSITSNFGNIDIGTSTLNAGNTTVDTLINDSAVDATHLTGSFSGSFDGVFVGDGSGLTGVSADGTLSGSEQIADDISGSLSNSAIAALGGNYISASEEGDAQGQIKLNGVNVDVNGMQTGDSPTFTNLTLTGDLEVQGTTTTINSTTLDIGDNIIALNGTGAALGGLHVNDNNGPVSGSILWDGANDQWIAGGSGSEAKILLATGDAVISSSAQVDHDAATNFVANEHIDHTSVSMTAGDGLTGGGDISSTRTFNVASANNGITVNADDIELDTASSTFTDGVKSKLNTEGVISSSAQIEGDFLNTTGDDVLSGSAQIAADISGSLSADAIAALGAGITSGSLGLAIAGDSGTDTTTVGVDTLTFAGDNTITATVTDNTVTFTAPDGIVSASVLSSPSQGTVRQALNGVNTDVDTGLQTGDSPTFAGLTISGNVTISGDLQTDGTVTNINTADLNIEDKFILLNSGSSSGNSGIIAQNSATNGEGTALFFDDTANRWSLDYAGADANDDTVTTDAYIAAVAIDKADANYQKDGNIHVDGSGDVFIYVE